MLDRDTKLQYSGIDNNRIYFLPNGAPSPKGASIYVANGPCRHVVKVLIATGLVKTD